MRSGSSFWHVFFRKINSWIIIFSFLLSSIPELNEPLWAQTTFSKNALPAQIFSPETFSHSWSKKINSLETPDLDLGEIYQGQTNVGIFLIRDLHCQPQAQLKVARGIEKFCELAGVSKVFIEGASDEINMDLYQAFPDAKIRHLVALHFLEKGYLTGPEFLSMEMGNKSQFKLYGVENSKLYLENFDAFQKIKSFYKKNKKIIEQVSEKLKSLKKEKISKNLNNFMDQWEAWQNGELSLPDFLARVEPLIKEKGQNIEGSQKILKWCSWIKEAKGLNSPKIQQELNSFLHEMEKKLTQESLKNLAPYRGLSLQDYLYETAKARKRLKNLVEKTLKYRLGKISPKSYLEYVKRLYENHTQSSKSFDQAFSALAFWYVSLEEGEEMKRSNISKILNRVMDDLTDQWAKEEGSQAFIALYKDWELLKKGFRLEFERNERRQFSLWIKKTGWKNFSKDSQELGIVLDEENFEKIIQNIDQFYDLAIKRDHVMVNNLLKKVKQPTIHHPQITVLIAGGFHTEGIQRLLKKKGISYAVWTPKMTGEFDNHLYEERMIEQARAVRSSSASFSFDRKRIITPPPPLKLRGVKMKEEDSPLKLRGVGGVISKKVEKLSAALILDNILEMLGKEAFDQATFRHRVEILRRLMQDLRRDVIAREADLSADRSNLVLEDEIASPTARNDTRASQGNYFSVNEVVETWLAEIRGEEKNILGKMQWDDIRLLFEALDPEGVMADDQFDPNNEIQRGLYIEAVEQAYGELFPARVALTKAYFDLRSQREEADASEVSPDGVRIYRGKETLELLGMDYPEFQRFIRALLAFEEEIKNDSLFIAASSRLISMRTGWRMAQDVLEMTKKFKDMEIKNPLGYALIYAFENNYSDLLDSMAVGDQMIRVFITHCALWLGADFFDRTQHAERNILRIWYKIQKNGTLSYVEEKVARALMGNKPVLFEEEPGSDPELMEAVHFFGKDAQISEIHLHPFTDDAHLMGRRIPREQGEGLEYGYGEILRAVEAARKNPGKKHILIFKNVEAMEPGIRTMLQEILRIREIRDPHLGGSVRLPDNIQFLFTMEKGVNLEDDSFLDRVLIKVIQSNNPQKEEEIQISLNPPLESRGDRGVNEDVTPLTSLDPRGEIEVKEGKLILAGTEILLAEKFHDLTSENLHDELYKRLGLILDEETIKMLIAMQMMVNQHKPILRIEGASGVGKTFTARAFASLTGRDFSSNPVNRATDISEFIGGYEANEEGNFKFNPRTLFREVLEKGGVIALSELNALIDENDKVSLAWWLQQLAESKPDAEGFRTIYLTELPTAAGKFKRSELDKIRVSPKALVIIDTNPETNYGARGTFPKRFKEATPVLKIGEFIQQEKVSPPSISTPLTQPLPPGERGQPEISDAAQKNLKKIQQHLNLFLKFPWEVEGKIISEGITDDLERNELSEKLATLFNKIVQAYLSQDLGKDEDIIFTKRELKRLAEDVMYAKKVLKKSHDEALMYGARIHLVSRWKKQTDRDKALEIIEAEFAKGRAPPSLAPKNLQEFILDQSIDKNRTVHVYAEPQTDVAKELEKLKAARPNLRVVVIPATDETDRFMLEGGFIPTEAGGMALARGVLGRLIHAANNAPPGEEVLYVLDNAHNIPPQEIIALNEFLQDRLLKIKGRNEGKLPLNAHILFLSRQDSETTWSQAEQSRAVPYGYSPSYDFRQEFVEQIKTKALDWNPYAEKFYNVLSEFERKYREVLEDKGEAYRGRISDARWKAFLERVVFCAGHTRVEDYSSLIRRIEEELDLFYLRGLDNASIQLPLEQLRTGFRSVQYFVNQDVEKRKREERVIQGQGKGGSEQKEIQEESVYESVVRLQAEIATSEPEARERFARELATFMNKKSNDVEWVEIFGIHKIDLKPGDLFYSNPEELEETRMGIVITESRCLSTGDGNEISFHEISEIVTLVVPIPKITRENFYDEVRRRQEEMRTTNDLVYKKRLVAELKWILDKYGDKGEWVEARQEQEALNKGDIFDSTEVVSKALPFHFPEGGIVACERYQDKFVVADTNGNIFMLDTQDPQGKLVPHAYKGEGILKMRVNGDKLWIITDEEKLTSIDLSNSKNHLKKIENHSGVRSLATFDGKMIVGKNNGEVWIESEVSKFFPKGFREWFERFDAGATPVPKFRLRLFEILAEGTLRLFKFFKRVLGLPLKKVGKFKGNISAIYTIENQLLIVGMNGELEIWTPRKSWLRFVSPFEKRVLRKGQNKDFSIIASELIGDRLFVRSSGHEILSFDLKTPQIGFTLLGKVEPGPAALFAWGNKLVIPEYDGSLKVWDTEKPEIGLQRVASYEAGFALTAVPLGDRLMIGGGRELQVYEANPRGVMVDDQNFVSMASGEIYSRKDLSTEVTLRLPMPQVDPENLLQRIQELQKEIHASTPTQKEIIAAELIYRIKHSFSTGSNSDSLRAESRSLKVDVESVEWMEFDAEKKDLKVGDVIKVKNVMGQFSDHSEGNTILCSAVLPDGRLLTAGWGSVEIYDSKNPNKPSVKIVHSSSPFQALGLLPNNRFVTGEADGTITIYDFQGNVIWSKKFLHPLRALGVLSDGRIVAGGTWGKMTVYNPSDPKDEGESLSGYDGTIHDIQVLPDDSIVVVGAGGYVKKFELKAGSTPQSLGRYYQYDGRQIIYKTRRLSNGHYVVVGEGGAIKICDPNYPDSEPILVGHYGKDVHALEILPDDTIVVGGDGGEILAFEPKENAKPHKFGNYGNDINMIRYSPADGKILIGGRNGVLAFIEKEMVGVMCSEKDFVSPMGKKYSLDQVSTDQAKVFIPIPHVTDENFSSAVTRLQAEIKTAEGAEKKRLAEVLMHVLRKGKPAQRKDGSPIDTLGDDKHSVPLSFPKAFIGNPLEDKKWIQSQQKKEELGVGDVFKTEGVFVERVSISDRSRTITTQAVLPDGRIAYGFADGWVELWDPKKPHLGFKRIGQYAVGRGNQEITVLKVVAGKLLIAGKAGYLEVWDPEQPTQKPWCLGDYKEEIYAIEELDGEIFVGGKGAVIRYWTLEDLKNKKEIQGEVLGQYGHEFSSVFSFLVVDGKLVIGGGVQLEFWDSQEPEKKIQSTAMHEGATHALQYLDGKIVALDSSGHIRYWDKSSLYAQESQVPYPIGEYGMKAEAMKVLDGKLYVGGYGGELKVWDPESSRKGLHNIFQYQNDEGAKPGTMNYITTISYLEIVNGRLSIIGSSNGVGGVTLLEFSPTGVVNSKNTFRSLKSGVEHPLSKISSEEVTVLTPAPQVDHENLSKEVESRQMKMRTLQEQDFKGRTDLALELAYIAREHGDKAEWIEIETKKEDLKVGEIFEAEVCAGIERQFLHPYPGKIRAQALLPNGELVVGGERGELWIYNTGDLNAIPRKFKFRYPAEIHAIKVLKDGRVIVAGKAVDYISKVWIYDPIHTDARPIQIKHYSGGDVYALELLNNSLVAIQEKNEIKIYDPDKPDQEAKKFSSPCAGGAEIMRLLKNGLLAVGKGASGGDVEIFDPAHLEKPSKEFVYRYGDVAAIESLNEKELAVAGLTTGGFGKIKIYNLENYDAEPQEFSFPYPGQVYALQAWGDDYLVAAGSSGVVLLYDRWDLKKDPVELGHLDIEEKQKLKRIIFSLQVSPEGQLSVAGGNGIVKIFDLKNRGIVRDQNSFVSIATGKVHPLDSVVSDAVTARSILPSINPENLADEIKRRENEIRTTNDEREKTRLAKEIEFLVKKYGKEMKWFEMESEKEKLREGDIFKTEVMNKTFLDPDGIGCEGVALPNGQIVIIKLRELRFYNPNHPEAPIKTIKTEKAINRIELSANGNLVLYEAGDVIEIYDPIQYTRLNLIQFPGSADVDDLQYLPDERLIVRERRGDILIYDLQNIESEPYHLKRGYPFSSATQVLPNGQLLVRENKKLRLYQLPSREVMRARVESMLAWHASKWKTPMPEWDDSLTELGKDDSMMACVILPNGNIAIGTYEGQIKIYDIQNLKKGDVPPPPTRFAYFKGKIIEMALLSPTRLVVARENGLLEMYDLTRPDLPPKPLGNFGGEILSLSVLKDGRLMVTGEGGKVEFLEFSITGILLRDKTFRSFATGQTYDVSNIVSDAVMTLHPIPYIDPENWKEEVEKRIHEMKLAQSEHEKKRWGLEAVHIVREHADKMECDKKDLKPGDVFEMRAMIQQKNDSKDTVFTQAILPDGRVVYGDEGELKIYHPDAPHELFQSIPFSQFDSVQDLQVVENKLYMIDRNANPYLYLYDFSESGKGVQRVKHEFNNGKIYGVWSLNGKIYVANDKGEIYVCDFSEGPLKFKPLENGKTEMFVDSMQWLNGKLYVSGHTEDGSMVAISMGLTTTYRHVKVYDPDHPQQGFRDIKVMGKNDVSFSNLQVLDGKIYMGVSGKGLTVFDPQKPDDGFLLLNGCEYRHSIRHVRVMNGKLVMAGEKEILIYDHKNPSLGLQKLAEITEFIFSLEVYDNTRIAVGLGNQQILLKIDAIGMVMEGEKFVDVESGREYALQDVCGERVAVHLSIPAITSENFVDEVKRRQAQMVTESDERERRCLAEELKRVLGKDFSEKGWTPEEKVKEALMPGDVFKVDVIAKTLIEGDGVDIWTGIVLKDGRVAVAKGDKVFIHNPQKPEAHPIEIPATHLVRAIEELPDGRLVVSGVSEMVTIHNTLTPNRYVQFTHLYGDEVNAIKLLPNDLLAVAGRSGKILIYDLKDLTRRPYELKKDDNRTIFVLEVLPNGTLFVADYMGRASIYSIPGQEVFNQQSMESQTTPDYLIAELETYGIPKLGGLECTSIHSCALLPDGTLALGGDGGEIFIYDVSKVRKGERPPKPKRLINFGGNIRAMTYLSPHHLVVAGASGAVKIYNLNHPELPPREIFSYGNWVKTLKVLEDGRLLIAGFGGEAVILELNVLGLMTGDKTFESLQTGESYRLDDVQSSKVQRLEVKETVSRNVVSSRVPRRSIGGRGDLVDGIASSADKSASLAMTESEQKTKITEALDAPFTPKYPSLPFYFALGEDGIVYLNYQGRWYPTKHKAVTSRQSSVVSENNSETIYYETVIPAKAGIQTSLDPGSRSHLARLSGMTKQKVRLLQLSDIVHPLERMDSRLKPSGMTGGERTLIPRDFLMETEVLKGVEASVLKAFQRGWAVDLEGGPGGGKTSMAREVALLLGLPSYVFQMHGQRTLSDWIGGYSEDGKGHLTRNNLPNDEGHFRQELLEAITHGGVYVVDEGAVGKKGRELLNWLAPLLRALRTRGDGRKIFLHEFPTLAKELGIETPLEISLDFHLVITNNKAGETQAREVMKSEVATEVVYVDVDEDDGPETLQRLFLHFTQDLGVDATIKENLAKHLSEFHWALKERIGKDLGVDDKDRHYLSKREIRRAARLMRWAHSQNSEADPVFDFYVSLRIAYESMFTHAWEKDEVERILREKIENIESGSYERVTKKFDTLKEKAFGKTVRSKIVTGPELEEAFLTKMSMEAGEPVLLLGELGARVSDVVRRVSEELNAEVNIIDADPQQSRQEILGGPFPDVRQGSSKNIAHILGKLVQHLMTKEQMEALESAGEKLHPQVLWIRNIDLWSEDLRTALNGFLEDGYIRLEKGDGTIETYYRPSHVHIIADMGSESIQDFSSAFFNRWVKIGISRENPPEDWIYSKPEVLGMLSKKAEKQAEQLIVAVRDAKVLLPMEGGFYRFNPELNLENFPQSLKGEKIYTQFLRSLKTKNQLSDFEKVLVNRFGMSLREAEDLTRLYVSLMDIDSAQGAQRWKGEAHYGFGPTLFYALAESIQMAKREDSKILALERQLREQYDVNFEHVLIHGPPPGSSTDAIDLYKAYISALKKMMAEEILRIIGTRLKPLDRPDFEQLLHSTLDLEVPPGLNTSVHTTTGTLEGQVTRIGNVALQAREGAKGPLEVSKDHRVRYGGQSVEEGLAVLARASQLGKAVALVGEPGVVKTTLTGHFAEITGRKYYKFQSHKKSRVENLTFEVEQEADGTFHKKIQELYQYLREGNVVIDIDEANAQPEILWLLGPVLRGEEWIYPIFPGEPPFKIGRGVQLVFTYNPAHFSGRSEMDKRILDLMIVAWLEPPKKENKPAITETFWGVWAEKVAKVEEDKFPQRFEVHVPPVEMPADLAKDVGYDHARIHETITSFDQTTNQTDKVDIFLKVLPEYFLALANRDGARYDQDMLRMAAILDGFLARSGQESRIVRDLEVLQKEYHRSSPDKTRLRYGILEFRKHFLKFDRHLIIFMFTPKNRTVPFLRIYPNKILDRITLSHKEGWETSGEALVIEGHGLEKGNKMGYFDGEYALVNTPKTGGVKHIQTEWTAHHELGHRNDQAPHKTIPKNIEMNSMLSPLMHSREKKNYIEEELAGWVSSGQNNSYYTQASKGILNGLVQRWWELNKTTGRPPQIDDVFADADIKAVLDLVLTMDEATLESLALYLYDHPRYLESGQKGAYKQRVSTGTAEQGGGEEEIMEGVDGEIEVDVEMVEGGATPEVNVSNPEGSDTVQETSGENLTPEMEARRQKDLEKQHRKTEDLKKKLEEETKASGTEYDQMIMGGQGQAESIFDRILRAFRSKRKTITIRLRSGLEVDPIAHMLRLYNRFIKREEVFDMQTHAVSVLMDFSGSLAPFKKQIAYAVRAIGDNFWKLKWAASRHFYFDLSFYTGADPVTMMEMGRLYSESEWKDNCVKMGRQIGDGDNNLLNALSKKLKDFVGSDVKADVRRAKLKTLILFTDGQDTAIIGGDKPIPSREFQQELNRYRALGIEIFAIGFGAGAKPVEAFHGKGQHFIKIGAQRPYDVPEVIAKIMEARSRGLGMIPDGDVTHFFGIDEKGAPQLTPEETQASPQSFSSSSPSSTGGGSFARMLPPEASVAQMVVSGSKVIESLPGSERSGATRVIVDAIAEKMRAASDYAHSVVRGLPSTQSRKVSSREVVLDQAA